MRMLKLGMQGSDVLNVENAIATLGFKNFKTFEVDGVFDVDFENVVKYIQCRYTRNDGKKLDVDGIIGPDTLEAIERLYQPKVNNFGGSIGSVGVNPKYPTPLTGKLEKVHPILATSVLRIISMAREDKLEYIVTQGLRTFEEQDKLFRQRPKVTNARGGQSYHNYGIACDVAAVVNGKISWNENLYKPLNGYADTVGLEWGGDWKFVDMPHLQIPKMPATRILLTTYNQAGGGEDGIEAVWKKHVK